MSSFAPGLRLHDRFTLVERVGVGGMSQVWRAVDEVLGRSVAVKVLGSALAADPVLRQATWREARAAARLAHPHVIQVYDYGEATLPGGALVPYLVMELVEGESLAGRLRAGPLPWSEAVRIGAQVAAALAAAHRLGVVHRDVKPGNVMLTPAGAKVLDFGIAALAGSRSDDGGFLVGTPAYAAPEQLRSSVPERGSDVYGLGVLLYQALTGHLPVPVTSWADAAAAHRSAHPVPAPQVPGLPLPVTQLVAAALAPDPADRPSAEEVASRLAAAVGLPDPNAALHDRTAALPMPAQEPDRGAAVRGAARPPSPPTMIQPYDATSFGAQEPATRGHSRRMVLVALISALVAAGLAFVVVAALLQPGEPARVPHATAPSPTTSAPPSPTGAPLTTIPSEPDAILAALHRTIDDAAASGAMSGDAAEQLRDKVDELRDADGRGKGNQRKRAGELQKRVDELQNKIDDLRDDEDVDEETADRLIALLQSLSQAQAAAAD